MQLHATLKHRPLLLISYSTGKCGFEISEQETILTESLRNSIDRFHACGGALSITVIFASPWVTAALGGVWVREGTLKVLEDLMKGWKRSPLKLYETEEVSGHIWIAQ